MSIPHAATPAKFFAGLITSRDELIGQASRTLARNLGTIDLISERLAFNFTAYYEDEMGKGLFRRFLFFEDLALPDRLSSIKKETDRIEEGLRGSTGRQVNIDPGYINSHQVVLGTNKNYSHRIYLQDGVYADLTLVYHEGNFRPLAWTYPDYSSPEVLKLLKQVRERYLLQLRGRSQV